MKINNRELEVIGILGYKKQPMTSTQIVNAGKDLTQSTVQAVCRKLMAAGYLETVGVTHSGNVLSRQFALTDQGKAGVLEDLVQHYRMISSVISLQEAVAALQTLESGVDVQ